MKTLQASQQAAPNRGKKMEVVEALQLVMATRLVFGVIVTDSNVTRDGIAIHSGELGARGIEENKQIAEVLGFDGNDYPHGVDVQVDRAERILDKMFRC